MLSRREVLAGGVVGGLAGRPGESGELQPDREGAREVRQAIRDVASSLDRAFNTLSLSVGSIAILRRNFEQFIRGNGKFPDFCDIGTSVFFEVYDWHVRNRQQIVVTRQQDNRYTIQFMFTTLILRFENEAGFIGVPFDKG